MKCWCHLRKSNLGQKLLKESPVSSQYLEQKWCSWQPSPMSQSWGLRAILCHRDCKSRWVSIPCCWHPAHASCRPAPHKTVLLHFSYCILLLCLVAVYIFSLFKTPCNCLLCAFILFLSSWIIFTIITLNPLSGRSPIITSLSCSSGGLSCSFAWNMFLGHFILLKFLFIFLHMSCVSHVSHEEVALCRGCPVCPSSTLPSHHPKARDQLVLE